MNKFVWFHLGPIHFSISFKHGKNNLKFAIYITIIRGLSKKYPTLIFSAQTSDATAAPLCTVEEGGLMSMLEFFHSGSLYLSLAGGRKVR